MGNSSRLSPADHHHDGGEDYGGKTLNFWRVHFDQIAFTLDVLSDENLHQIGHAIRLRDAKWDSMYVVTVGGLSDHGQPARYREP